MAKRVKEVSKNLYIIDAYCTEFFMRVQSANSSGSINITRWVSLMHLYAEKNPPSSPPVKATRWGMRTEPCLARAVMQEVAR